MPDDAAMEPETLTTVEAARRARVSERTMRNWLAAGLVEHTRDEAGKRRVLVASLDAHLAANGATPAALPEAVPGLPELVAELGATRKALGDAQWQVGYLTAQLEAERVRVRLLEAGPATIAAPEAVPEAPAILPEVPEEHQSAFRQWLRQWWGGRP